MRLAAKLVLLFLFGLLLIVGLFSYLTIQQDRRLAIDDHQRHASDLVATLQPSIDEARRKDDQFELQNFIAQSTREIRYMHVRVVESKPGGDQSPAPTEGRDAIVAEQETTTVMMRDSSGKDVLYTYLPIAGDDNSATDRDGSIEVSAENTRSAELLRHSIHSSVLALLGVATLSGIVILVGGIVMVGKPLNKLIEKVQRVGQGDLGGPVQVKSTDELGRLGKAINEMCDQLAEQRSRLDREVASRVATLEQLRHSDRLSTVGRMAAGIAHEIGTPLNVVTGRAELIACGQLTDDKARESALAIKSEAQRIAKIIRELLDFARQSTPKRTSRVLNDIIEVTANLMRPLAAKHGAEIKLELPCEPLVANVDAAQIQQVLTNLIVNAIQATTANGLVTIALSEVIAKPIDEPDRGPRPCRKVSIRDNGLGMPETIREHIFEPFYTTKDIGLGTGLGLSISHGIIHEHEGWIEVESELGQGSCFSVYLPNLTESEPASDE